jgi:hypothetical protein
MISLQEYLKEENERKLYRVLYEYAYEIKKTDNLLLYYGCVSRIFYKPCSKEDIKLISQGYINLGWVSEVKDEDEYIELIVKKPL